MTAIDHNFGGADALQVTSRGVPVAGATVKVYAKAAYEAGGRTALGQTVTDGEGRWKAPIDLDAGWYKVVIEAPGFLRRAVDVYVGA